MMATQTLPTPAVLNVDPKPQPKSRAKAPKPEVQPEAKQPQAKSKTAPPAPAPAKPAAKAEPKPMGRVGGFGDDAVIRVDDKVTYTLKGKRGIAVDLLKDGMTIAAYKAALAKREKSAGGERLSTYAGYGIQTALSLGLIKITAPK
jgi:hypothetical protein